jgi:hypothetical protein
MGKTAENAMRLMLGAVLCLSWVGCDSRPTPQEGKKPPASQPTTRGQPRKARPPRAISPASRPAATGPAPRIEVDQPRFNFGKRWSTDPTVKHDFVIRNDGQLPLRILGVVSDCGCTAVGAKNVELEPGKSWNLPVSLEPSHLSPIVALKVTVISNDPVTPRLDLRITGLIQVPVKIDPHNGMYFGQIRKDDAPQKTLILTNNTADPMDLKLTRCVGQNFEAEIEPVEAGKKYRLILKARPPYKSGVNSGLVELTTGLKQAPKLEIRPQAYLPPRVLVTPDPLMIPQPLPDGGRQEVYVRNNGNTDLKVTRASTPLAGVQTEISALPNGKVYTIALRLPKGLIVPPGGSELIIHTNDPEFAQVKVNLFGQGLPEMPASQPAGGPAS